MTSERAREVAGVPIADAVRDQLHLQVGVAQQTATALQPQLLQVLVGTHADLLAKDAGQPLWIRSDHTRQLDAGGRPSQMAGQYGHRPVEDATVALRG